MSGLTTPVDPSFRSNGVFSIHLEQTDPKAELVYGASYFSSMDRRIAACKKDIADFQELDACLKKKINEVVLADAKGRADMKEFRRRQEENDKRLDVGMKEVRRCLEENDKRLDVGMKEVRRRLEEEGAGMQETRRLVEAGLRENDRRIEEVEKSQKEMRELERKQDEEDREVLRESKQLRKEMAKTLKESKEFRKEMSTREQETYPELDEINRRADRILQESWERMEKSNAHASVERIDGPSPLSAPWEKETQRDASSCSNPLGFALQGIQSFVFSIWSRLAELLSCLLGGYAKKSGIS